MFKKFAESQGADCVGAHELMSEDDFARLEAKSMLCVSGEGRDHFRKELCSVLYWLKYLDRIDMEEDPDVTPQLKPNKLLPREDRVDSCAVEDILSNAPDRDSDYFVMGKVEWKE